MVTLAAAVSVLLGALPAIPAFASSTASTGLSTALSTGTSVATGTSVVAAGTSATGTTVAEPVTATTSTTSANSSATPVQVTLDIVSGGGSKQSPLTILGHVRTTAQVTDLTVQLYLVRGGRITRSGLAAARQDPAAQNYLSFGHPVPVTTNRSFTISDITPTRSSLTVYPVKVAAFGQLAGDETSKELGAAYTDVVWSPADPQVHPTAVATVLPIADQPRLRSDGILTDNKVATLIAKDGRLDRLLSAVEASGAQSTVALALDPTLLQEIGIMAEPGGYRYASPGGAKPTPQNKDAVAYLKRLRDFANASGHTVFALPYGDADLTALIRAGKANDALYAMNTGKSTVALALGWKDTARLASIAYPADGLADAATLNFLAGIGVTTAILSDQVLPASASTRVTPTALTVQHTSNGSIRALAADSTLTKLVSTDTPGTAGQPSVAAALGEVRAELAMITYESPETDSRLAVVALPRDWDPSRDWATMVLQTLTAPTTGDPGYTAFLAPRSVPTGAITAPSGADPALTIPADGRRPTLVYSASAVAQEIPTAYVDAVEHLRAEVSQLDPVLCAKVVDAESAKTTNPGFPYDSPKCALDPDGRTTVVAMSDTLLTALSVWWRGTNRPGAVSLSQEVDGRIQAIRGNVRIGASAKVTLTSRDGKVPLTVQNLGIEGRPNGFPMTVILQLSSNDRTRLKSPARQALTIRPNEKDQIEISVSSDSAGTFPVFVQVLTPAGDRLSMTTARILVRSTAYGAIASAITYATVGLFVAAVVLRQIRRTRRRRRGGGGPDGPTAAVTGVTPGGAGTAAGTGRTTGPVRRNQTSAAGAQRIEVERAYAGEVRVNPSEP